MLLTIEQQAMPCIQSFFFFSSSSSFSSLSFFSSSSVSSSALSSFNSSSSPLSSFYEACQAWHQPAIFQSAAETPPLATITIPPCPCTHYIAKFPSVRACSTRHQGVRAQRDSGVSQSCARRPPIHWNPGGLAAQPPSKETQFQKKQSAFWHDWKSRLLNSPVRKRRDNKKSHLLVFDQTCWLANALQTPLWVFQSQSFCVSQQTIHRGKIVLDRMQRSQGIASQVLCFWSL